MGDDLRDGRDPQGSHNRQGTGPPRHPCQPVNRDYAVFRQEVARTAPLLKAAALRCASQPLGVPLRPS